VIVILVSTLLMIVIVTLVMIVILVSTLLMIVIVTLVVVPVILAMLVIILVFVFASEFCALHVVGVSVAVHMLVARIVVVLESLVRLHFLLLSVVVRVVGIRNRGGGKCWRIGDDVVHGRAQERAGRGRNR
jgi:hypothetical protein